MHRMIARSIRRIKAHGVAGGLLVAALAMPAFAQDVTALKVAHLLPNELYLWKHGGQVFIDEAEKASDGRLKFEVFPSAQLGKDMIGLLESGLADITYLVPSHAPHKMPLSPVVELPGIYTTPCEGTGKLWIIA